MGCFDDTRVIDDAFEGVLVAVADGLARAATNAVRVMAPITAIEASRR